MKILAYCDASFDQAHNCGAVACSFSYKGKQYDFSMSMTAAVGSTEIETEAIEYALRQVRDVVGRTPTILLKTDCMPAIEKFTERPVSSAFGEVRIEWIQGHAGARGPDTLANEHCDRLAKQSMRDIRAQIQAKRVRGDAASTGVCSV